MNEENNNINNGSSLNSAMNFNTSNGGMSSQTPVTPAPVNYGAQNASGGVNVPPTIQEFNGAPVNNVVQPQPVPSVTPEVNNNPVLPVGDNLNNLSSTLVTPAAEPVNNVVQPQPVPPLTPEVNNNPVLPVGGDLNNSAPVMETGLGSQNPVDNIPPVVPPVESSMPVDNEEKPKKKTSPVVVIALILILLVGAAAGYYFLLETPQKIFGGAYNKLLSSLSNNELADSYIKYNLKFNVTDKNGLFDSYKDVINNISIAGTSGYDSANKQINTINSVSYKNKQIVDLTAMVDIVNNVAYAKLNNLYDKVLMFDSSEYTGLGNNDDSATAADYMSLKDGMMAAVSKVLDSADCKKELAVLDGARVTKSTLYINKAVLDTFYDSLLQNNEFLTKYAKFQNSTVEEVKKHINDNKNNSVMIGTTIVLYTSLIKNELLRLEIVNVEGKFVVTTNSNGYKYEFYEDNELSYNGTISSVKNGNNTDFTFSIDVSEFGVGLTINCSYSKADKPQVVDTTGAVNVDDLTDEEANLITSKLMENEAFISLISDLGLNYDTSSLM